MPVSSHGHRYRKMTRSREFFEIGEPFLFSPLSDPLEEFTLVPITPAPGPQNAYNCNQCFLGFMHTGHCGSIRNRDENYTSFIPACVSQYRKDGRDVYFLEFK